MSCQTNHRNRVTAIVLGVLLVVDSTNAHEDSAHDFARRRNVALAQAQAQAEDPEQVDPDRDECQLTIVLVDTKTNTPLAGLVRITNLKTGKAIKLAGEIHRNLNWYALPAQRTVRVPQERLRIEAFHGIETDRRVLEKDVSGTSRARVTLELHRIYDPGEKGIFSGNTHLHLMKITYAEAHRYLRVVPEADGLDLVFLSYLRRLVHGQHEHDYISNQILENSLAGGGGELRRLSQQGTLLANGEEHRHNFRTGNGYGHVMLLDLVKLIRPVSIGSAIMGGDRTDGIPLQRGIRTARDDGGTVIWCHNNYGLEDVPNWMAGLVHAQNIHDGGRTTSYKDSFYKYLNLGLRVPFSTGTDWFIFDFSRVYVPLARELTTKNWLAQLHAGKSYITNGPFLEFSVNDSAIGDTVRLPAAATLRVSGQACGRSDFGGLELVHNGKVISNTGSQPSQRCYTAKMDLQLEVNQPGWLALRIPLETGNNEFGKQLYAHTSPVYIEVNGRRIFDRQVAQELITEMDDNIRSIEKVGVFANQEERTAVLNVHRQGIEILQERLNR
jgi:hypothetical protein